VFATSLFTCVFAAELTVHPSISSQQQVADLFAVASNLSVKLDAAAAKKNDKVSLQRLHAFPSYQHRHQANPPPRPLLRSTSWSIASISFPRKMSSRKN
jgi:hypothetical protein